MTIRIGLVGAGEFLPHFTAMFAAHPGVGAVYAADLVTERAEALVAEFGLAGSASRFAIVLFPVASVMAGITGIPAALSCPRAQAELAAALPKFELNPTFTPLGPPLVAEYQNGETSTKRSLLATAVFIPCGAL